MTYLHCCQPVGSLMYANNMEFISKYVYSAPGHMVV